MSANDMHFGGHSRRHPWFDWVSAAEQADQIGASAAWLRTIGTEPFPFAYPYGGYSAKSPQLLRAHGFSAAFTTVGRVRQSDPFLIGRLDGEALGISYPL
jgi:peptidoglycan/xylan/chitin deacetylase (PgdA/CDA1 family)